MSNFSVANAAPATTTGVLTVATRFISFPTKGEGDIVNITQELKDLLAESGLASGTVTVFAPGATAAITTLEYEPGVVQDFQRLFDQIIPREQDYEHNVRLGDGNGHSHCRAGLLGPSLVVPFMNGRFCLGTWQAVCFVCLDAVPRDRKVVVQLMGV